MFAYSVILVAIAATLHNINGKPEAKYSLNDNEQLDNNNFWLGDRMDLMEKQMQKFGDIIQGQGKKMEPEDQWSCKRSPDILAYKSKKNTKSGKYMVKK